MQPLKFIQAISWSYILFFSCLLFSATDAGNTEISKRPGIKYAAYNNHKFYSIISAAEIKKAISKSKNKKIIINLYPSKLSGDLQKKDFTLNILFTEPDGSYGNFKNTIKKKLFKKQTAWYLNFLKNLDVNKKNVPIKFFLQVDDSFIGNASAISFSVDPEAGLVYYYLLSGQPGADNSLNSDDVCIDSICKCPVECSVQTLLIKKDSTGKCPPECPVNMTNTDKIMSDAINSSFDKK